MTKVLLLALATFMFIEPRMNVAVRPDSCLAPCNIQVELVINPRVDNRWAVITLDGPLSTSTSIKLHGVVESSWHSLSFNNLPSGRYKISAILYDTSREVSRHIIPLRVR